MSRCCQIGCEEEARFALRIVIPDLLSDETSAEGLLDLELCEAHLIHQLAIPMVRNFDLERFLWLVARWGTEPDFDCAYLEGVPIGGVDHQAFKAAAVLVH